jgi:hypothetical protein
LIYALHPDKSEGTLHFAHSEVGPKLAQFAPSPQIHERSGRLDDLRVLADNHPSLTHGQDFLVLDTEGADISENTGPFAVVRRAVRV